MDNHSAPSAPSGHPTIATGKTGLLLVNLGTPSAPTPKAVRAYLKEFLSDARVIELQGSLLGRLLWQSILRGIILNIRPRKSAAAYQKIWNMEKNESPLRHYTHRQAEAVGAQLDNVCVEWAMRYGTPSISEKLHTLKQQGCTRIAVMALYPQYSATTTASVYDEVFRVLKTMRWQPALRTIDTWHDTPAYIDALAASVRTHLGTLEWQPDSIIASYHGLPKSYFLQGDPYHCQCAKTTRLLREALNMQDGELQMTFQSRFGFQEWLTPYTDAILTNLAKSGKRRIAVIMPCFISDCLETLEEVNTNLREKFLAAGGTDFTCIPCLNDSPASINLLTQLARQDLHGWI